MWAHFKKWFWVYTGLLCCFTWLMVFIGDLTGHYYLVADQPSRDPWLTGLVLMLTISWVSGMYSDIVNPRKTELIKSGECKCEDL